MADRIRFHFDPQCPWSFQTARWALRLEELGLVRITWSVFSLTIVNKQDEGREMDDRYGAPALRTAVALRASHGEEAVGRFYLALGTAVHARRQAVDDPAVLDAALQAAGADSSVRERAMADPSTWATVQTEHDWAVREKQAFGVPTIVLDDGDGPAIFGPVLCDLPDDDTARATWEHVTWLVRNQSFAELKRDRPHRPDFSGLTSDAGGHTEAA